jgi:bifunctional ADP-heptose synthase (sugar kinase/adenylyltransferase)
MLTTSLIEHILTTLPRKSVGLLGDLFLDRYLDIDPTLDEPSVETGKTAYQVARVRSYPGALGTVLNNLAALGVGTIRPVTLIGDDGEGYELRQALRVIPAVNMDSVLTAPDRRTPAYTKPMYRTTELNRLDIKNRTPTPAEYVDRILGKLDELWDQADAWIVLDQVSEEDCGVVTAAVRERLAVLCERNSSMFVLADSRGRIGSFRHVAVKPNQSECLAATRDIPDPHPTCLTEPFFDACLELVLRKQIRTVFGTHSEYGTCVAQLLKEEGSKRSVEGRNVPAYPVSGPIDVCGAGDSCSAGITCAMMAGATPEQAAAFGNLVASITIQQIGVTGTATPEQVRARWKEIQGERHT